MKRIWKVAISLAVVIAITAVLLPFSATGTDGISIEFPSGSQLSQPGPAGTIRVDVGNTGGYITVNDILVVNVPAHSVVIRHPSGRTEVTIGGFTIVSPVGSAVSVPSPGAVQVLLGATGGTININGVNLFTASANTGVVFNANNTTTAIVAGTSVTVPTSNGPIVTNNGNVTITVTLPGQPAVTIPANGGNWFAVLFNSGGGGNVPAQIIESANTVVTPASPSRTGFTFEGWYSNAALTSAWNFGANTISSITTLYARWAVAEISTPLVVQPPQQVTPPQQEPETPIVDTPAPQPQPEAPAQNQNNDNETAGNVLPEVPLPPPLLPPLFPPPLPQLPTEPPPELPAAQADEPYVPSGTETDAETYDYYYVNETEFYIATQTAEYIEDLPTPEEPEQDIYDEYGEYEYEYEEEDEPVIRNFALTDIGNPVDEDVSHFRIVNRALGLQFLYGEIPAFTNGGGLYYTIRYSTNLHPLRRVAESNVYAGRPFRFLSPNLQNNEIITEISVEFDTVPAGFWLNNVIVYSFKVLDDTNVANEWRVTTGEESKRSFIISAIINYVDNVSGREGMYDAESWYNLQIAVGYAQAVLYNQDSTLEELEMAHMFLQQAIHGLNPASAAALFTAANIARIVAMLILLAVLIFALVKLLRYKKRQHAITELMYSG